MKRSQRLQALARGGKGKTSKKATRQAARSTRTATRPAERRTRSVAVVEDDEDEIEEEELDGDDDEGEDEADVETRSFDEDAEDEDAEDEDAEDEDEDAEEPAPVRRALRRVEDADDEDAEEESAEDQAEALVERIVAGASRRSTTAARKAAREELRSERSQMIRQIARSVVRELGPRRSAEDEDAPRSSTRRRSAGRGPAVAGVKLTREMPSRFKSMIDRARGDEAPVLELTKKEIGAYSLARAMKGVLTGDMSVCPYELELSRAAMDVEGRSMVNLPKGMWRTKNLATSPTSAGGILVPAQVLSAQIIPLLQASSIAYALGIMRMPGASGSPIYIPKITGGTTAYWVNHDKTDDPTAVTRSQPTFGQIRMEPHTLAASVEMANRLIELSSPAAEQIVRRQIARDMAIEVDDTVFNGTGADGQPIGILQQTGIQTTTSFGSAAAHGAYDKLIDMQVSMQSENVASSSFAWVMHPTTFGKLRKMKDNTDNSQPKARRLIDEGAPQSILGTKFGLTTTFPTDYILFGAMDYCVAPEWGSMFLSVDSQAVNRKFTTSILVGMELDFNITQDKAFHAASGVS